MRVLAEEIDFTEFLLQIGNGELNDDEDYITLPDDIIAPLDSSIVDDIYKDFINGNRYEEFANCVILCPRNIEVSEINQHVVSLLNEDTEHVYTSIDTIRANENGEITQSILPEYLNTLEPNNLPPYKLILRDNCIIMLIRSLNINEGLCNGTRLRIISFSTHLLKCEILSGDKRGNITFINRITLICDNDYPFTFQRRQFPVELAFTMTINKSQGQTFHRIGIQLNREVFSHGQLYVALSRVKSRKGRKVYGGEDCVENKKIKNIVYKEILNYNFCLF